MYLHIQYIECTQLEGMTCKSRIWLAMEMLSLINHTFDRWPIASGGGTRGARGGGTSAPSKMILKEQTCKSRSLSVRSFLPQTHILTMPLISHIRGTQPLRYIIDLASFMLTIAKKCWMWWIFCHLSSRKCEGLNSPRKVLAPPYPTSENLSTP